MSARYTAEQIVERCLINYLGLDLDEKTKEALTEIIGSIVRENSDFDER